MDAFRFLDSPMGSFRTVRDARDGDEILGTAITCSAQTAEQLVEAPTIVSLVEVIRQPVEQTVDRPVPSLLSGVGGLQGRAVWPTTPLFLRWHSTGIHMSFLKESQDASGSRAFLVNSTFLVCQVVVCSWFCLRVDTAFLRLPRVRQSPLVTASPKEYRSMWIFWDMTSSLCFRIQRSAGSDVWVHAHASVYGGIRQFFPFFSTWRWTPDPEVDSRPSLMEKCAQSMLRVAFSSFGGRPMIFDIMGGMVRPGSGRARCRHRQLHVQGLFCW